MSQCANTVVCQLRRGGVSAAGDGAGHGERARRRGAVGAAAAAGGLGGAPGAGARCRVPLRAHEPGGSVPNRIFTQILL